MAMYYLAGRPAVVHTRELAWQESRKDYEADAAGRWSPLDSSLWRIAADDFERLCEPATVDGVTGETLARFDRELHAECVDAESRTIYVELIWRAVTWANRREAGRLAA